MAKGDDAQDAWVVASLQSWAKWAKSGGVRNGYGESCLTLEEIRALPVRAYVPVFQEACERTHDAIRKLPGELQQLASAWYIREWPKSMIAAEMRVSESHVWRLHATLTKIIGFLLKNPGVSTPPLRILLKS
ncbi:hypothetical protein [Cupriavidus numazuensis]|uniref:RNA polymerase sigma factor 70 region 4 type 2 domain-containing protein n=1 Tax=Cupriavidus numazuensis TaxID=221992 RepID=A0ABN7PUV2_9BURK|nr:hypothetical protein [Cupriavidus numazuensis]CAG2129212.1 hypothetical protein LMG26411_00138 [Cupriavidus numazuensis]